MCGIGGASLVPGHQTDLDAVLRSIQNIQHHRGPDGHGSWIAPTKTTGLCHNRLSIIDISEGGRQPMVSNCGQFIITFNGEIYNYQDLRADLESKGHRFQSQSDTEVLLQAYAMWGENMLGRLRGMYAFALHDLRDGSVLCARDPIGKKPFVYTTTPDGVFFASEIPALRTVPNIDWRINKSALASMMLHNFRHIPDPHTAYLGIKRLRPGHAMRITNGEVKRIWRHWTPAPATTSHTAQDLRALLEESIRLRLQADVPVGALLSGGIDSTAITALMQRYTSSPIRTYALGMNEQDDDIQRARYAANLLGTTHREIYFDPTEQWDILHNIIATYGEPIMLLPMIHSFTLCRAIHADGVKVVLSGNGADELFYGYTGHIRTAKISRFLDYAGPLAQPVSGLLPRRLSWIGARPGKRKSTWYRGIAHQTWAPFIADGLIDELENEAANELEYWGTLCPSPAYIDESNFVGLMVENTHSITTIADHSAMMASVEMRAPFLDKDMIALALAIPSSDKIPAHANAQNLKAVLRQAVVDLIPPDLMNAPKRGFGMGIQEADLLRGPWRAQAEELLRSPLNPDGMFKPQAIENAWQHFLETGANAHHIAKLLSIQIWARMM